MIELPPALRDAWHCRGYYGSVSHNVKAIYQRYMGWFDGNPAHLWEHPTVEAATPLRRVHGRRRRRAREGSRTASTSGDFRWVAQVVNHVIFADPSNAGAKELQAAALRAARLRGRERDLAQLLPDRGAGAARGGARHADADRARGHRRAPLARSSSSTRSRSVSTGRGPGRRPIVLNWDVDGESLGDATREGRLHLRGRAPGGRRRRLAHVRPQRAGPAAARARAATGSDRRGGDGGRG